MPQSPDEIRAQVEEQRCLEEVALGSDVPSSPIEATGKNLAEFIDDCLEKNYLGDGRYYTYLHRGKFLYVKQWEKRPWLSWGGHHWRKDLMGEHITAVEQVAIGYLKAADDLFEPINRERGLLDQANSRVTAANKRAKEISKLSEPDPQTVADIDAEGKEAEADAKRHKAALSALTRKKKELLDRADRLRTKEGAEKCAWWAHHHEERLAIHGRELDQKPWLLACPNGIAELRTGKFRPGEPDDYLLKTASIEFPANLGEEAIRHYYLHGTLPDGRDPHPEWTAFQLSIQPDPDIRACMDRIVGYGITGFSRTEQYVVIYLGRGRNGKGTYLDTIQDLMGDLFWSIKPELLMESKIPKSAGAATPEIVMMKGRRIVRASETNERQQIDAAAYKFYSGGSKVNSRGLFADEEENFEPSWIIILDTNHPPEGLTKDFAMRQRLILIDFPYMFVDDIELESQREPHNRHRFRQKDKHLPERLQAERPYILLYLIRCCLLWQREGGINPPERLKARIDELTNQEDLVQQFIDVSCLANWSPLRTYDQGAACSLPTTGPDEFGTRYVSRHADNKGHRPGDNEHWEPVGYGCDPQGEIIFKEFYTQFKAWYEDSQSENDRYRLSKKEVGKRLRDKGFDVRNKGRGTVITGPLKLLEPL